MDVKSITFENVIIFLVQRKAFVHSDQRNFPITNTKRDISKCYTFDDQFLTSKRQIHHFLL